MNDKDVPWSENDSPEKVLVDGVPFADGKADLTKEQLVELLAKFWWLGKEN